MFNPNENFIFYLYWMVERMNIFWRRLNGEGGPYTQDEILQNFKFTNVYRSLDRVSQYFIREIVNKDGGYTDHDLFWRILIFKHFNKIETWEWLISDIGQIDWGTPKDMIIKSLGKYSELGNPVYSNAFMLTAPFMRQEEFMKEFGLKSGSRKYDIYLSIFYKHFKDRGGADGILNSVSLENLFNNIKKTPSFASFLAMQFTTDFNWSRLFNFDENSFVSASVGSVRGIDRIVDFNSIEHDYQSVLKWIHENLDDLLKYYSEEYGINLEFKGLPGYKPTLMDLQNCACESDKYMRGLGIETVGKKIHGKRIKSKFKLISDKIDYVFPSKWNVGKLK